MGPFSCVYINRFHLTARPHSSLRWLPVSRTSRSCPQVSLEGNGQNLFTGEGGRQFLSEPGFSFRGVAGDASGWRNGGTIHPNKGKGWGGEAQAARAEASTRAAAPPNNYKSLFPSSVVSRTSPSLDTRAAYCFGPSALRPAHRCLVLRLEGNFGTLGLWDLR